MFNKLLYRPDSTEKPTLIKIMDKEIQKRSGAKSNIRKGSP